MQQIDLPLEGELTYTELCTVLAERRATDAPRIVERIGKMLTALSSETKLGTAQRLLQSINEQALRLSALDPEWVPFSDSVFEQVILPSKTVATAAIRMLCDMFAERTNNERSNTDQ